MAAQVQKQCYILGVQNASIILQVNVDDDTIQFYQGMQNFKVNNWCQALSVGDDDIFITGGLNESGKVITNDFYHFKPQTQQMITLPQMNQVRYVHSSIMKDDKLYVLGGRQYGPDFESVLSHCEVFDDGKWKVIAPFSKRRSNFSSFIYQNRIHVLGGFDGRKHTKTIEAYDEEKNIWRKIQIKLPRGMAGMHIYSQEPHKLLIIGGITSQGPSSNTQILNLKDATITSGGQMLETRTLPLAIIEEDKILLLSGNPKETFCESYDFENQQWVSNELNCDSEVIEQILSSGLKGFTVTQSTLWISNENSPPQAFLQQQQNAEDFSLLVGNDEFPFIMTIPKSLDEGVEMLKILPVPVSLQLQSYMSSCLIENSNQTKTIFLAGGIDNRIIKISKKAFLIKVDLSTGKITNRSIGKLAYHRYAASCVFKSPYIYVIGGRGYQNDILSLHRTVERYNIESNEWEQFSPLNEAKCSTTASIINDRIYIFGGYIGDAKISDKIECLNEGFSEWNILNVRLPFPLEGLSSISPTDNEVILIGGKGQDGSQKQVIKYTWKELEEDNNTNGDIIGYLNNPRSLPKPVLMNDGQIMIFGGQFFDNPEIQFGEIINPSITTGNIHNNNYSSVLNKLEKLHYSLGGPDFLGMFSTIPQ